MMKSYDDDDDDFKKNIENRPQNGDFPQNTDETEEKNDEGVNPATVLLHDFYDTLI